MVLTVREMGLDEVHLMIDYFYTATPEYLEMMGVDPSRLLPPQAWYARLESEFALPVEQRQYYSVMIREPR